MLRFKAIVLLLALAIFSLSACKKDDNEDDNGPDNFLSWAVGDGTVNTYAASSSGGSGTVTITELNNNIATGTFEFTGVNFDQETKTITNGTFTANLSITDF